MVVSTNSANTRYIWDLNSSYLDYALPWETSLTAYLQALPAADSNLHTENMETKVALLLQNSFLNHYLKNQGSPSSEILQRIMIK